MSNTTFQYYQHLYIKTTGEATQDENGDWVKAADTWARLCCCRAETNGKASEISNSDGRVLVYSDIVYLPNEINGIEEGQQIAVLTEELSDATQLNSAAFIAEERRNGKLKAYGQVFKFDAGRLNGRIWI